MIRKNSTTAQARAGGARVSIIWLITMIILFFVALGFGYLGYEEAAKAETAAQSAQQAAQKEKDRAQVDADHIIALSQAVGAYDASLATPRSSPEALKQTLDGLRGVFPDMGPEVNDLTKALAVMKNAYEARGKEIATLQTTIQDLKSQQGTFEQSLRDAVATKASENEKLQKQITDDAANASQKQAELEKRIATLTTQLSDSDAQVRGLRGQLADAARAQAAERQTWTTRTNAVARSLKFLDEPEKPDGEVVAVANDLGLGWINIGARQRLAVGTRFSIVSGTKGSKAVKGTAEVTAVNPTSAEVRVVDVADPFDPVVAGDLIFNPLYDPYGERHAVLAGRFMGQFDEAKLRVLLKDMGITVQDALDFNTDYLILGSDLWTDEEGNQLEEALSPTELPIYKDAEANGVQIVSIKKLASYFIF